MEKFVRHSILCATAAGAFLASVVGAGQLSNTFQPKQQEFKTISLAIPHRPSPPDIKLIGHNVFNDSVSLTGSINEELVREVAIDAGIVGDELIAFMAQLAHESGNFRWLTERSPRVKIYATGKTAKALGNTGMRDAKRFIGRGFIQITGRWNYEWMERELQMDLTSSDEAAARAAHPAIAARIAVIYWIDRVRPRVKDFTDVHQVTKPINSRLHAINKRIKKFVQFAVVFDAHHLAEEYM